jgi:sulfoxide reductase heme-binding subunit YedZ
VAAVVTRYWRRRLARHALLAAASLVLGAAVYAAVPAFAMRRLSLATAYLALALTTLSLMIGPWNVLRARANPVSQDVRRDVGIWAGLVALAHTVVGLQVHMQGRWWQYFVWPPDRAQGFPLRTDAFGAANVAGLGATLVFLLLLALSNDVALRRLGSGRWKALQRWNYAGFGLTAAHAALYQVTERRALPAVAVFSASVVVVGLTQLAGYRRRRAAAASTP